MFYMNRYKGMLIFLGSLWVSLIIRSVHADELQKANSLFVAHVPIRMMILPGTAHYLEESIERATKEGAKAVVVTIDTPGGMLTSSQEMVQTLFRSTIPVIIFVAPSGATATSAGVFITLAGHIAAMAPGTTIGAAHPVSGDGKDIEGDMRAKVENFASALVRSIAQERQRNIEWAEDAVKKSLSITDQEAIKKGVIDLVAPDIPSLLKSLKGRSITLKGSKHELEDLSQAEIRIYQMSIRDEVVNVLANPTVLALLWMAATTGISIELYNPGLIFPGVIGAISLVLALAMSQIIPVSQGAVLLLVLGGTLLTFELFVASGILGVGGILSLLLGALYLFEVDGSLGFEVNRSVLLGAALAIGVVFLLIGSALTRIKTQRRKTGKEGLIGARAVVIDHREEGLLVRVNGEIWKAQMVGDAPVEPQSVVRIVEVLPGLVLKVDSQRLDQGSVC